jgi:hypothetical protein
LPGAVVKVFCNPVDADCADPLSPIGEFVSDAAGAFSVVIPGPIGR